MEPTKGGYQWIAAPAPPSLSSSSTILRGEKPLTSGERREVVKKEKVSLMKRLTSKRKSKSRPASAKNGFSCDNPCFVDPSGPPGTSSLYPSVWIHVRSGSCPSDVLGGGGWLEE